MGNAQLGNPTSTRGCQEKKAGIYAVISARHRGVEVEIFKMCMTAQRYFVKKNGVGALSPHVSIAGYGFLWI
jgi:hypothetical protein